MHLNALLDLDVVAVETDDQINIMLELAAPERAAGATRPPGTLQVVLDRSGSMGDGRLEAAKQALFSVIGKLSPADSLGVVVFDDEVGIAVPAGPLTDKQAARKMVGSIWPGGMTNLASGLVRGTEEARRAKGDRGATLLLLSDGHANTGVTDHSRLEQLAATGLGHGVTTSTIGIGLGYDEELMTALSRGGAGTTHFAEHGDEAGAAIAQEVGDLLDQVAQAAGLTVRASEEVAAISLVNDLAIAPLDDGFVAELGDFYAGEERRVLMAVDVPAKSGLGLVQVCEIELRWTDADTLESHTVTVPVHVNVVPGDQAAGRIPDPVVRSEVAFQKAQEAKRDAGEALRRGDATSAAKHYREASADMDLAASAAPAGALADEALEEAKVLRNMALRAREDDAVRVAKFGEADRIRKSRRRGRG